jgi:hypothetical protein
VVGEKALHIAEEHDLDVPAGSMLITGRRYVSGPRGSV